MTTENSSQETTTASSDSSSSGSDSSQDTSTQTSSSTSPANELEARGARATAAAGVAPVVDAQGNPVAAPVYQPNFKFKAFGKEQEIDPLFRSLIKDKASEEQIRKLHEKAYAMEPFQQESKKYKTEFDQYKQKVEPDMRAMGHFNNLLKNKDWDNFFGGLKVPEDEIFNWVQKRLEMRQMPPDQRAEFERQAQVRQQNYAYENQLSERDQEFKQLKTETRVMQLDNVLARQDVQTQAAQVDAILAGSDSGPRSFRELVVQEALDHFNRTGEDLSAQQAVQLAQQKYSRFLAAQNQGAGQFSQQGQAGQPGGQQITSTANAPIIPHVGGSSRSPVSKAPRSLEDLKKLGREAASRESRQQ